MGHLYRISCRNVAADLMDNGEKIERWVIDSSATHYITYKSRHFINFKPMSMTTELVDRSTIKAEGCGDIILECTHKGVVNQIKFCNV